MSIVTYGYGQSATETSPLPAAFGYGRTVPLFPPITEVVGQIVDVAGRVYAVAVERSWSVDVRRTFSTELGERVMAAVAVTRTSTINLTRAFAMWVRRVFSANGDE